MINAPSISLSCRISVGSKKENEFRKLINAKEVLMLYLLWNEIEWIWALYSSSTKSERFSQFKMLKKNYGLHALDPTADEIKTTMDNAVIYRSNKTKSAESYLKLKIHWLPQYSPTQTCGANIRNV